MKTTTMTYHRDGTVTYWDVYRQAWARIDADLMSDEAIASLTAAERDKVARLVTRHAAAEQQRIARLAAAFA